MLGFLIRLTAPTLAGCAAGLVIAANWPDPSSPTAGLLIGAGATAIGGVIGTSWALRRAVAQQRDRTNP